MADWAEYKSGAKKRGSLALELFVVVSTPVKSPEEVKAVLPDHLAYQKQQEDAGKLFLAGPLSDETGEQMQGKGMIIYRAESLTEARQIAEQDPMHQKQAREFTLRRWLVNEGSLQLDLKLTGQRVSLS